MSWQANYVLNIVTLFLIYVSTRHSFEYCVSYSDSLLPSLKRPFYGMRQSLEGTCCNEQITWYLDNRTK